MNETFINIINDCGNQTHFTRKFLDNYWSNVTNNIRIMMDTLNKRIYDQFIQSIVDIDIAQDKKILTDFGNVANISNISRIVANIEADFTNLEQRFANISGSNSTLSQALVQPTANRVS